MRAIGVRSYRYKRIAFLLVFSNVCLPVRPNLKGTALHLRVFTQECYTLPTMIETRKTLCNRDCPDACSIVATIEDGQITRIRGDKEHPITRGFLCYRTSLFLATQYSPERLTSPLVRRNGEFQPVSWDEALDLAADRLTTIRQESGPAAI